ncbi:hypothetical protein LIER_07298 [Lithospermum erythrorhizon]|uniref:Protein kinase domain-containing protein n=1 Tax=Lithospermum erythrorhizon TaxID=34254 RepID=A0AAV3P819_LITER
MVRAKNLMTLVEEDDNKLSGSRKTVVVGVKFDHASRELLTWALVKVAQPGDHVIALHVLSKNDVLDRDGKSCFLTLVKQFDSILEVYDGLCNLKQVDLKLKICRGESVRKILIREAISYHATDLIVGIAKSRHTMYSSTSVAKYCAKKLGKVSSVLAVNNGKIVFRGGASFVSYVSAAEIEHHHGGGLLNAIQRTLKKNPKGLNDGLSPKTMTVLVHANHEDMDLGTLKSGSVTIGSVLRQKCAVCSSHSSSENDSGTHSSKESAIDVRGNNSMAIVPIQKSEAASLLTMLIRELPERKAGWPLLRRALSSKGKTLLNSSKNHISVVQCSMQLPDRPALAIKCSDENGCSSPYGERDAVFAIGREEMLVPSLHSCKSDPLPQELEGFHEKYLASCRLFSYGELLTATSNFMPGNIVGKGGNSQVYRGCLPNEKQIAVKILKPSDDALKEFVSEIEIITTLHHKNIISLSGFCYEGRQLLLVYDLISRGSLEENLHGNKKDPLLFGWCERYKVALGVAEALNYLHNRNDRPVIHRDVKSSNILLSDDYEPQLSDFGLAKRAASSTSHISCTDVAGTFGYLAPEYFMYGKVNDKIDVYAFGVVLFELLSGRKPICSDYPKGEESLVMWAKPIISSGKFTQLLDHCLGNNYDWEHLERMVLAAALCIRRSPRARPQMRIVLKLLHGDIDIIKWARLQVNFLDGSRTKLLPFASLEDVVDEETMSQSNRQSHLNLALLGVEEDSISISSPERSLSLEDYLKSRMSISVSSSFD